MRDLSSRLPQQSRRLFRLPLTRQRMLRDADEEMAFHVAMRVAEFRAAGMSDEEATLEAQRRFGDTSDYRAHTIHRASHRAARLALVQWLGECDQDLRQALRQFLRAPAFGSVIPVWRALRVDPTDTLRSE